MGIYSFYYPPENKVLVARNAEFLENSLITQEASGSLEELEIIQEEDTHPSIDTSLNHEEDDLEIDEPQRPEVMINYGLTAMNVGNAILEMTDDVWILNINKPITTDPVIFTGLLVKKHSEVSHVSDWICVHFNGGAVDWKSAKPMHFANFILQKLSKVILLPWMLLRKAVLG
ncbi:hypothetical protein Tco_1538820 [Tanacetum coccineum]